MKALLATLVLMSFAASSAGAIEIKDKWGIGAGVFGWGGEVSLIRSKSERSAWLFDIGVSGRDQTSSSIRPSQPTDTENSNDLRVRVGPGYRRFVRPDGEFSPYWDLHAGATFSRSHRGGSGSGVTRKSVGANAEFSFGLEYFTRWHFSVAAHSSLVGFDWSRVTTRYSDSFNPQRFTGHETGAAIGLSPALFVRGYF